MDELFIKWLFIWSVKSDFEMKPTRVIVTYPLNQIA